MPTAQSTFGFTGSEFLERVQARIDAQPGQITAEAQVFTRSVDEVFAGGGAVSEGGLAGAIGGAFADIGEAAGEGIAGVAVSRVDVSVDLTPSRLGRIQQEVRNAIPNVASGGGVQAQLLQRRAQNLGGGFNLSTETLNLDPSPGETESASTTWNFQPIRVPVPQGESVIDQISDRNLPRIAFTFNVPDISSISGGQETFRLDIPPEAFIEEVSLDLDCSELFSDIFDRIQSVARDASSLEQGARAARNRVRNFASEVGNQAGIGVPSDAEALADNLRDIQSRQLVDAGTDRLQEIRTEVEQIDTRENALEDLRDRASDIRSDIRSNAGSNCRQELLDSIDNSTVLLSRIEEAVNDIREIKDALLNALQGIESIDCTSAFPNVANDIASQEVTLGVGGSQPAFELPLDVDRFQQLQGNIEDLENTLSNNVPQDNPCFDTLQGRIDDMRSRLQQLRQEAPDQDILGCEDVSDSIVSALNDFESSASNFAATKQGNKADLLNTADAIRDRIENEVEDNNPCKQQLLDRVSSAVSSVTQVERGCSDIPRRYRDAVSSFQGAVAQFTSKDQLARLQEDKTRLLDESDEVISQIQDNVNDRNPCKSELLSRARNARGELRATAIRPETAVPCDQRFQGVGNALNSFEDQVLQLSAPVSPEQVQSVANEGEQIIQQIENNVPADDPCRSEMSQKVRTLVERVQSLTTQIRVETEEQDRGAQRREELINQLLGSIDAVQTGGGEGEGLREQIEEQT